VNNYFEHRVDERYQYEAVIWHENLLPGRFYRAEINNISQSGLYFESDQVLYQGEKIYIGARRPRSAKRNSKECAAVVIKWCQNLKDSDFKYGYGAKFIDPDNSLINIIIKTQKAGNIRRTGDGYQNDPRAHKRGIYPREKIITSKNRHYRGSIANISRGGAFIRTKNQFALGQMILLDIREGNSSQKLRLKGWVIRLTPKGIAVRFDRRSYRDRRKKFDRRAKRTTMRWKTGLR
jgi:Tfp pilus assembly protein PilZ